MDKVPITRAGFQRMEEELKHLKTVERPNIIKAIAEARAHGDLSENAEYNAAREAQSLAEGRIKQLEDLIARAEIIEVKELQGSETVKFGASIIIIDEETEEELKYQIVGEYESDIKAGLLSVAAPIARALIGKSQGDSVEVHTPKGPKTYEILAVDYV